MLAGQIVSGARALAHFKKPQRIVPYYNISIADGCLGGCAYCAIRNATGHLRSRPMEAIARELEAGVAAGQKLIQLVSEDTGAYGQDIGSNIVELLERLLRTPGDYELIMIDFNPRWLVKYERELIDLFARHRDHLRELFVPVQSGSTRILKAMRRAYTAEETRAALLRLKGALPHLRLRTTIIIGFPGETEEDFAATRRFVEDIGFFEVTLNKYEDRPGSASSRFPDKIPQELIDARTRRLAASC